MGKFLIRRVTIEWLRQWDKGMPDQTLPNRKWIQIVQLGKNLLELMIKYHSSSGSDIFYYNRSTKLWKKNVMRKTRAQESWKITDKNQLAKGNQINSGGWDKIESWPTLDMVSDYFTKPLQGRLFRKFYYLILGI